MQNKEQQEQQAKSAISEVYNDGTFSIVKADTPEAIVEVANCEGSGANSWCVKGLDYAKQYGPPGFFIRYRGKQVAASFPHAGEIRDVEDLGPSTEFAWLIFPAVKFIIDNYHDGIWPGSATFKIFGLINNDLVKQSLSPEDQQKYEELSENPRAYPINTLSEVLRLEVLKQVPDDIEHITNPTEKEQIVAITNGDNVGDILRLIFLKGRPSEKVQLAAANTSEYALVILFDNDVNPSEQVQMAAVSRFPAAIEYLRNRNPSEQVQLAAVNRRGQAIRYITNPSEQVQLAAVDNDAESLYDIIFYNNIVPSEKVQLLAVTRDASLIQHLMSPSEAVQVKAMDVPYYLRTLLSNMKYPDISENAIAKAVSKEPKLIKDVIEKVKLSDAKISEKIQFAVIADKGSDVQFLLGGGLGIEFSEAFKLECLSKLPKEKYPISWSLFKRILEYFSVFGGLTEKVQLMAIKHDPLAISRILNPTETVQIAAVIRDPNIITLIKNSSEKAQIEAVSRQPELLEEIKDPSEAVKQAAQAARNKPILPNLPEEQKQQLRDMLLGSPPKTSEAIRLSIREGEV
jgi:hypothetical protein